MSEPLITADAADKIFIHLRYDSICGQSAVQTMEEIRMVKGK